MVLWQTWWAGIYRVEFCLGGNYITWNFLDYNNPGGNFLGGNFPGGSYPGWEFSRWEFSRWELSWLGIFRLGIVRVGVFLVGNFPGGNCPVGSYPGWELSEGGIIRVWIFWVGVFLVPLFLLWKGAQSDAHCNCIKPPSEKIIKLGWEFENLGRVFKSLAACLCCNTAHAVPIRDGKHSYVQ